MSLDNTGTFFISFHNSNLDNNFQSRQKPLNLDYCNTIYPEECVCENTQESIEYIKIVASYLYLFIYLFIH